MCLISTMLLPIQNEYAARVHDLRTYHTICRDIVTRWVYPLVPDAQLLQDSSYTHSKRYIYKENGCKAARECRIGDGCVLGKGCVIEGSAVLERTIVGRDCFVGSGAVVIESHLWAGTTHTHLSTHTHTHTHIHVYTHTHTHAHTRTQTVSSAHRSAQRRAQIHFSHFLLRICSHFHFYIYSLLSSPPSAFYITPYSTKLCSTSLHRT